MPVIEEDILNALRTVQDPDLHKDIVSLGMTKNIKIEGSKVSVTVELTTPACPLKGKIQKEVETAISNIGGVKEVHVEMTANVRPTLSAGKNKIQGIKNVIAIASGKGGVGKSTVSVNLAVSLAKKGASVGLMDADIYGPNIPLMMGLTGKPRIQDNKMIPSENYGVKVMSMGFLIPEDQAVIWRGPMLHGAIQQLLSDVAWGDLDYLLVDLPPGTGDVQLSLSQAVPMTGAVVVTTPQAVSLQDARKAIAMFQKVRVPILGIIENMSYFTCSHCRERTEIFSHGGGRQAAETYGMKFLGELPLDIRIREGSDLGKPMVISHPDEEISKAFTEIAEFLAAQVSISNFTQMDFAKISL